MGKTIYVNRAQVRAAKALVRMAERGTAQASPAIRAIANAKKADRGGASRSTGRAPAAG